MKRIINSRRGATLTELVVVLAVIVIASAMVVSFSSLIGGKSTISNAKLEAMQDVRIAESTIEGFIEGHEGIDWPNDQTQITELSYTTIIDDVNNKTETDKLYFRYGKLVYNKNGAITEIELESVQSITFEKTETLTDVIYFCTVTYKDPGHDDPATYTFCVNPYAGETIKTNGGS